MGVFQRRYVSEERRHLWLIWIWNVLVWDFGKLMSTVISEILHKCRDLHFCPGPVSLFRIATLRERYKGYTRRHSDLENFKPRLAYSVVRK